MSNVCSVFKNVGEYRPFGLLSVISKLLEAVISNKVVDHLNMYKLLGDKQYGFRSVLSTADILNAIIHRISDTFDNITRTVALDISMGSFSLQPRKSQDLSKRRVYVWSHWKSLFIYKVLP